MESKDRPSKKPDKRTSFVGTPESAENDQRSDRRASLRKSKQSADEVEEDGNGGKNAELRETKASTAAADVDVEMTDAAANESDISGATLPAKGTNNEQLASQNKQKNAKAEKSPARPGRMYREEPPAKEELAAWTKFGSRKRLTNAQAKILVLERMEQAKKDRQEEIDAPEDMVEDEDLKRRFMKGEPRDYSIKEGD